MPISVEGTRKNQLEPCLEIMGDAPVLSHFRLLKKILGQNRPVCWSIVVKEKPTIYSPFFSVRFLLTASLRRRRMSMYRNVSLALISVNYTSEFRGLLELLVYKFTCNLVSYQPDDWSLKVRKIYVVFEE